MAAYKNFIISFLCICLSCCNNIQNDRLTDTPPGTDTTDVVLLPALFDSVEIPHADTTVTLTIKPTNRFNKKPDTVKTITIVPPIIDYSELVRKIYTRNIGVRELTGKNDGKSVEVYLKSVGLPKGNPWCAAFVHYCLAKAGVKNPITGWSPTALNISNPVLYSRRFVKQPKAGDVFTLYYPTLRRIGHTGFFDSDWNGTFYTSVEGNTSGGGSRDGDGVYKRKRSYRATYAISRWIKD